jgi:hypothetical protein
MDLGIPWAGWQFASSHKTISSSKMLPQNGYLKCTLWHYLYIKPKIEKSCFPDDSTVPLAEYASAVTTVPLDIGLWHRRLAHHHLAGVRMLLDEGLVTGMKLDSKAISDPICEPGLAGKMHSNPFPSSLWHASRPLELIHTDVHQVPYPSFSGFRYWVSFIDDYSRYCFILPINLAKSDVFEVFKQFKAYAENQSERKIKILRDNKGGEYMSNTFLDFTTQCGIEREHTVRHQENVILPFLVLFTNSATMYAIWI